MNDQLPNDQDFNLWILLCQARDTIFRARGRELTPCGVTVEQAGILFVVQAIGDQATPTEISRWMLRKPHTISTILTRMEKDGLVSKSKDLDKKSRVIVALTEKGRQVYSQSSKRKSIREIMSCLSEEEHNQLGLLLQKLRDSALKNIAQAATPPFP
jgi:MarR family transcriptional regulator for hemolysin